MLSLKVITISPKDTTDKVNPPKALVEFETDSSSTFLDNDSILSKNDENRLFFLAYNFLGVSLFLEFFHVSFFFDFYFDLVTFSMAIHAT